MAMAVPRPIGRQIAGYGPAGVVDAIDPAGCITAGDWQRDGPWRRKKGKKPTRANDDIGSDSVIE